MSSAVSLKIRLIFGSVDIAAHTLKIIFFQLTGRPFFLPLFWLKLNLDNCGASLMPTNAGNLISLIKITNSAT